MSDLNCDIIVNAVNKIADLEFIEYPYKEIVDDVYNLASELKTQQDFEQAIDNTVIALKQIYNGVVLTSKLKYNLQGFDCYHYQRIKKQNEPADMRIVYKRKKDKLHVIAFGLRHAACDVYNFAYTRI